LRFANRLKNVNLNWREQRKHCVLSEQRKHCVLSEQRKHYVLSEQRKQQLIRKIIGYITNPSPKSHPLNINLLEKAFCIKKN
jgi:hypothetical protein